MIVPSGATDGGVVALNPSGSDHFWLPSKVCIACSEPLRSLM
ncbi:Uncharacterised protein [Mycobacteroides abscessus subsp. abscessus]|nr:Uncharacterised protein [Mycobacteroides abscessus subsp. abscessus]